MTNGTVYFFWDAYLHWANILDNVIDGPFPSRAQITETLQKENPSVSEDELQLYEPIFIQLKKPLSDAERQAIVSEWAEVAGKTFDLFSIIENPFTTGGDLEINNYSNLLFDPTEVLIGFLHAALCNTPIEFFAFRPVAGTDAMHTSHDHLYNVIDVGPPAFARKPENNLTDRVYKNTNEEITVGAVIDNDIGFLNDTFCVTGDDGKTVTRFQAIWLQARDSKTGGSGGIAVIGKTLTNDTINGLLKRNDEDGVYRDLNTELHAWKPFRRAPPRDTHGTAVAALAYGNDFYDEKCPTKIPLLGVQLPPEAAACAFWRILPPILTTLYH